MASAAYPEAELGELQRRHVLWTRSENRGRGWCRRSARARCLWRRRQPVSVLLGDGDGRINSFGIGGRIEVRAGYLTQAAAIDSPLIGESPAMVRLRKA